MPISKPEEHEINRAGKRLLRDVLEPLGWVVNDTQEDYGIDTNVQVFDGQSPTGAWFHVQLKSSTSSDYSADRTFISQEFSISHAKHYTLEMRQPVLIIHADVTSRSLYWYAPQLDRQLVTVLRETEARSITVRIPTSQQLPVTAEMLLTSLDKIYLTLSNRELATTPTRVFVESLKHFPDQAALRRALQEKNDTLRLQTIRDLCRQGRINEARPRAQAVLSDPDSAIEFKFWAEIQLDVIDYTETLRTGKPQSELPKVHLVHAKALRKLTASGPKALKLYSIIARHAAELEILVHEHSSLLMVLQQHTYDYRNPAMVLGTYARRSALTKSIVSKYNRCLRFVRYASNHPDRWLLGRALTTIVNAIAKYLFTLHHTEEFEAEQTLADSALQVCKLSAWISEETDDPDGVTIAVLSALLTTRSVDSDAYRWAEQIARGFSDPEIRADTLHRIERAVKRWKGEPVEGDYHGNTLWDAIQNMATALGIDMSNEKDPLVRGLRIAVKDDSPEPVLIRCEHLLVSLGAAGPVARRIRQLFNISTAGSKVVHCTLHNYHIEGKEQETAYNEFKRTHCDSCPDKKPRPKDWRYTDEVRETTQARYEDFVENLNGTPNGFRYTDED